MTTITRADWRARSAPAAEPLNASEVIGLAFHWPAMSKPLYGVAAVSAALRNWQAYHMDTHGWRDIGYQIAVDQDGNRYILRGLDGQSGANGDEDVNRRYGAVLLVLAPGEHPSAAMMREVHAVVRDHRRLFPKSRLLVGHNDVRPEATACPGPVVMRLLGEGAFNPPPTWPERLDAKIRETRARLRRLKAKRDRL
jgi:hypothetical protein